MKKSQNHEGIKIDGKMYFPLRKQYRGVLNPNKNLPPFHANTWMFQSMAGIVHFHYALN